MTPPAAMSIGVHTDPALRRRHRSAVAALLLQRARTAAEAVGWSELGDAPGWMGLAPEALDTHALRAGTVLVAPALRLWIAAPAVQAARSAMGTAWWQVLMAHADWPALQAPSAELLGMQEQQLDTATLAALFRQAGAAVLVSSLPHGALRHAASEALSPVGSLVMPRPQALAVVALTQTLAQGLSPADRVEAAT